MGCKFDFLPSCSHRARGLDFLKFENPGAVSDLVFHVELGVVRGARLPHLPDDFQPALTEAAEGLGMGFAAFAQGVIVGCGPRACSSAVESQKMDGPPQHFVASSTEDHFMNLS